VKRAFVIGHPIAHSRSPLIHNHWIAEYGIDGTYEAIDVAPEDIPVFLSRIRSGEFVGGNVTIPHKEAVFAACDSLDDTADVIGAVNTLSLDERGLRGDNTDWWGFAENLNDMAPGWADRPGEAIVLGAGGAARAILLALALKGFGPIHVLNRTVARAEALAIEMGPDLGKPVKGAGLEAFDRLASEARIVVNTSAMGMHGEEMPALDLRLLPKDAIVTDLVYVPLETPLLAQARAVELPVVDGLGMLLHQAVPGFERWFGVRPAVTAELRRKVEATL
jgi:shikimate dehydrogenase